MKLETVKEALAKLPPAISGSHGHDATFRAACLLVSFGLGDYDAMALLREWNGTHCQPPWREKELAHKLADARKVAGCTRARFTPKPAVRVTWTIKRRAIPAPRAREMPIDLPLPAPVVVAPPPRQDPPPVAKPEPKPVVVTTLAQSQPPASGPTCRAWASMTEAEKLQWARYWWGTHCRLSRTEVAERVRRWQEAPRL